MKNSSTQKRSRFARRLSWLVVASLTSAALFAPGAVVKATDVVPIYLPADIDGDGTADQNPTCSDLDGLYGATQTWLELEKINGMPANGTYGVITIYNVSGQTFSWSSTVGVDAVLVKAGSDNHALYVYAPTSGSAESFGDTNLTHGPTQQGTSHVSFCYDTSSPPPSSPPPSSPPPSIPPPSIPPPSDPPPSIPPPSIPPPSIPPPSNPPPSNPPPSIPPPSIPPPSDPPPSNPPPSTPPTASPTAPPSSAPQGAVGGATESPAPVVAPVPEGAVEGATGAPGATLPPTDTLGTATTAPAGESWRLILLAMAGLVAVALLLTPATAVVAKKDRR